MPKARGTHAWDLREHCWHSNQVWRSLWLGILGGRALCGGSLPSGPAVTGSGPEAEPDSVCPHQEDAFLHCRLQGTPCEGTGAGVRGGERRTLCPNESQACFLAWGQGRHWTSCQGPPFSAALQTTGCDVAGSSLRAGRSCRRKLLLYDCRASLYQDPAWPFPGLLCCALPTGLPPLLSRSCAPGLH